MQPQPHDRIEVIFLGELLILSTRISPIKVWKKYDEENFDKMKFRWNSRLPDAEGLKEAERRTEEEQEQSRFWHSTFRGNQDDVGFEWTQLYDADDAEDDRSDSAESERN